jgi:hypothetical protein
MAIPNNEVALEFEQRKLRGRFGSLLQKHYWYISGKENIPVQGCLPSLWVIH